MPPSCLGINPVSSPRFPTGKPSVDSAARALESAFPTVYRAGLWPISGTQKSVKLKNRFSWNLEGGRPTQGKNWERKESPQSRRRSRSNTSIARRSLQLSHGCTLSRLPAGSGPTILYSVNAFYLGNWIIRQPRIVRGGALIQCDQKTVSISGAPNGVLTKMRASNSL